MRSLADIIDALDQSKQPQPQQIIHVVNNVEPPLASDRVTPMEQPGITVPPLQQKIEVLKKLADIPSSRAQQAIAQSEDEPWAG